MLEPMSIETPLSWAIRLLFVAILAAGVVLGFAWMRRSPGPTTHRLGRLASSRTTSLSISWVCRATDSPSVRPGIASGTAWAQHLDTAVLARQMNSDRQKDVERTMAERSRQKEARPNKQHQP